jgi:general secretion pathway protein D
MNIINKSIYGVLLSLIVSSSGLADCSYELFSISSAKNNKIIDFIEQLSDECEFSIIVADSQAKDVLNNKLNKTHLKNLTIDEVLAIILNENNLSYTLENKILKISYLTTKVFEIDYILSQRKGTGSTDVTLSSSSAQSTGGTATGGTAGEGSNADSGIKIESTDEVIFWKELDLELQHILNRPEDNYTAVPPIINKNAGLITVTGTTKQINRLQSYLKRLQDKVQLQVLIDVQLLSVTLDEGKTTGIDWKQLYALQNLNIQGDFLAESTDGLKTATSTLAVSTGALNLNEVIKFLKTQGDVNSISNPKVLTLNNQPALITAGKEIFYKLQSTQVLAGGSTGSSATNDEVLSVFAGVLLDITPEISDDSTITLKINPSLSEIASELVTNTIGEVIMPPDLNRRQLSSVVTVKDGNRVILGGLINTTNNTESNKVPLLGDIPLLGYLFKSESITKHTQELVIIIEPHIVKKEKNTLSLSDLGYNGLSDNLLRLNKTSVLKDMNQTKEKEEDEI